jgi:hypothetical protein
MSMIIVAYIRDSAKSPAAIRVMARRRPAPGGAQ